MDCRLPNILVPYQGPSESAKDHDIFLYLRPQSNGVLVESTILKEVELDPEYRSGFRLVYLANLPGDFLNQQQMVERHYALRIYFAVHGRAAFTVAMQQKFTKFTQEEFSSVRILGAFEALQVLGMSPRELFEIWVDRKEVFSIVGQSIKRYQDAKTGPVYIINYDIPMLLHINHRRTDIAAMMFRSSCGYGHFLRLIERMKNRLTEAGIISATHHFSRVLHFSRSPFEELLDASGHLYNEVGEHIPFSEYSFAQYLMSQGICEKQIRGFLEHPLVVCESLEEENLFEYTKSASYAEALEKIRQVLSIYRLSESFPTEALGTQYATRATRSAET